MIHKCILWFQTFSKDFHERYFICDKSLKNKFAISLKLANLANLCCFLYAYVYKRDLFFSPVQTDFCFLKKLTWGLAFHLEKAFIFIVSVFFETGENDNGYHNHYFAVSLIYIFLSFISVPLPLFPERNVKLLTSMRVSPDYEEICSRRRTKTMTWLWCVSTFLTIFNHVQCKLIFT